MLNSTTTDRFKPYAGSSDSSPSSSVLLNSTTTDRFKPETAASMGALLADAKSETWFVDALNGSMLLPRGLSDSAMDQCLVNLDSDGGAFRIREQAALDCLLEIGYFGRKEAVEAMLKQGLVNKLVEMQRSELGGDLIEIGRFEEEEDDKDNGDGRQGRFLESHPFASCVARFAVQLEVGEGLRQREKRAFKREILENVRDASVSHAEAATIVAEVLWGSSEAAGGDWEKRRLGLEVWRGGRGKGRGRGRGRAVILLMKEG